jgi:large subunit ribosomal protein L7/L12
VRVSRHSANLANGRKSRRLSSAAAVETETDSSSEESQNGVGEHNPKGTPSDGRVPIVWTTHRLKPEQIQKVDAIFHKVLWLDLFEMSMLTALINERLGLQLTPKQTKALERQMAGLSGGGTGAKSSGSNSGEPEVEAAAAAPKTFDLKLMGFDAKSKIKVIKEVRAIANLGLKEAKELVESAPKIIQKDLKPEQAEELKALLEAAGAQIELV